MMTMTPKDEKPRETPDQDEDEIPIADERTIDDFELEYDDAEPDDRRRDPLRKP